MTSADWFPGVTLLGMFDTAPDWPGTGCWLLHHNGEAAVLELPPRGDARSPADVAAEVAAARGLRVKFLLCTHAHSDHFSRDTLGRMRDRFPDATPVFHAGFRVKDVWNWLPRSGPASAKWSARATATTTGCRPASRPTPTTGGNTSTSRHSCGRR